MVEKRVLVKTKGNKEAVLPKENTASKSEKNGPPHPFAGHELCPELARIHHPFFFRIVCRRGAQRSAAEFEPNILYPP